MKNFKKASISLFIVLFTFQASCYVTQPSPPPYQSGYLNNVYNMLYNENIFIKPQQSDNSKYNDTSRRKKLFETIKLNDILLNRCNQEIRVSISETPGYDGKQFDRLNSKITQHLDKTKKNLKSNHQNFRSIAEELICEKNPNLLEKLCNKEKKFYQKEISEIININKKYLKSIETYIEDKNREEENKELERRIEANRRYVKEREKEDEKYHRKAEELRIQREKHEKKIQESSRKIEESHRQIKEEHKRNLEKEEGEYEEYKRNLEKKKEEYKRENEQEYEEYKRNLEKKKEEHKREKEQAYEEHKRNLEKKEEKYKREKEQAYEEHKRNLEKKEEELNRMREEKRIKIEELNRKREERQIKTEELNRKREERQIKTEELNRKREEKRRKIVEQEEYEKARIVDATQITNSIYDLHQSILMHNNYVKIKLQGTVDFSKYNNSSSNKIKSSALNIQIPLSFDLSGTRLSAAYIYSNVDGSKKIGTFKQNAHTAMLHVETPKFLDNSAIYGFISYTMGSEEINVSKDNKGDSFKKVENSNNIDSDFTILLGGTGVKVLYDADSTFSILGDLGLRGYSLKQNNKISSCEKPRKHRTCLLFGSISTNLQIGEMMYIVPFVSAAIDIFDNKVQQLNEDKKKLTIVSKHLKAGLSVSTNFNSMYFDWKVYMARSTNDKSIKGIAVTFGGAL